MGENQHATVGLYWKFAAVLCFITFIEWGVFKNDTFRSNAKLMIPLLLGLSVVKFTMVCGWYMHLRYDASILAKIFGFSLGLAFLVYTIMRLALWR